jgi:hypothetical protein
MVPVEARRQGAATAFLLELGRCAAKLNRAVRVEAVLSESLQRILNRLGFVKHRTDPCTFVRCFKNMP